MHDSSGGNPVIQILVLDFPRTPVPERGMEPTPIIERFDVSDNLPPRVRAVRENEPVEALVLQRADEGFDHSVVATHPCPPHPLAHAHTPQFLPELQRRVV